MLERTSSASQTNAVAVSLPWKSPLPAGREIRLVWVVDPETSNKESIAQAAKFSMDGVVFEAIGSQAEALERLRRASRWPDVIITDFRGDLKINGAEFIARARRMGGAETRFVMFSGMVEDEEHFRRVAGMGCELPDAIVPKPDVFRLGQVLAGLLPAG